MLKDDNYRIREEQLHLEKGLAEKGVTVPGSGGSPGRPQLQSATGRPHSGNFGSFSKVADARNRSETPDGSEFVVQQHQRSQLQEAVRHLEQENRRLRETRGRYGLASDASTDVGVDDVSEEEYQALQERLARLQQNHLRQLQEARQLKGRSYAGSARTSGVSTPLSSAAGFSGSMALAPGDGFSRGSGQDARALQEQYKALVHEQGVLKSKIRKLAHT